MLILSDKSGIVDMTADAIQRRTNIPMEIIEHAIPLLEAPDPDSRSKDCEGRRIVRLDPGRSWGWRIVNFLKYRESATVEMTRMAEAMRKKIYRAKYTKKSLSQTPSKETNTEAEADMSHPSPGHVWDIPSLDEVKAYAQIIGLAEWKAADTYHEMESCGWKDYNHRRVSNWQSFLVRVRTKWEADGRPTQPPTNNKHANLRSNDGQSSGRNKGTYNEGKSSQYAAAVVSGKTPVPDVQRPNSGKNVATDG